jgi:hypothetical protein
VLDQAEHLWTRDEHVAMRLRNVCQKEKVTSGADLAHLYLARRESVPPSTGTTGWLLHFDDQSLLDGDALTHALLRSEAIDNFWLVQEIRELPGSELATWRRLPPEIQKRLRLCQPDYSAPNMEQLLSGWPTCERIVTSRFHGALIGAWQGSRVLVIERDDKLRGVVHTLGCRSLPNFHDAATVAEACETSRPVSRDLLEAQHGIAWRCCVSFFQMLRWKSAPSRRSDNLPSQPFGTHHEHRAHPRLETY